MLDGLVAEMFEMPPNPACGSGTLKTSYQKQTNARSDKTKANQSKGGRKKAAAGAKNDKSGAKQVHAADSKKRKKGSTDLKQVASSAPRFSPDQRLRRADRN
eukprot:SAG31_NODE_1729_length_7427_cov_1.746725_1_plen_102_part_00